MKGGSFMGKKRDSSRRAEREAVYSSEEGGQAAGSGTGVGSIPRGIEVLVKKASVDPEFKKVLLEKRADAAWEIGLDLDDSEAGMLSSIPIAQLESIIERTTVGPESRRVFLGKAASLMLAAIGVTILGCGSKGNDPDGEAVLGIRPEPDDTTRPGGYKGIRPDRPAPRNRPPNADRDSLTTGESGS
jgi:hypothetical protein